ncbi:unnamed protein product [Paramecium primaurelia]|uniref:Uncharacterized protein n=1 Tax=Paramecium primaurelia TaxID=5886 RepID=A0A8S1K974_PARPR|nr:unnamed protein product [Paramecium primaurelia]
MLNDSQDIASKLQCQISKEVNEILQIENINRNEYGIYRTKKGHLIKFDEFNDYILDQDVLVYIDKKVKSQYIMQLEFEKNYDIEQYVIEGRNYVYIRTKLMNMQNKQEIINLHLLNIYQQGSIKQLIQETLNGLQFSFKFKDQQDYFVQIIFATLFDNDFKGTESQVNNLVQQISKNYVSCQINECKKDKELFNLLQNIQLQQIPPKFIKECSLKTSQSIQYYTLINQIYAANIELEEKNEINFNIEFTLECIRLINYIEERNHIKMEFDQYFCIDNLIYHFRFSSIQNQQRFNYYVILIQVNNDINQNQLIEELFFIIENLKCQKNIQQNNHNVEKIIQMNSSFIQQQQNQNKEGIKIQEDPKKNIFIEENIMINIDEGIQQINTQSKLLYSNNNEKNEGTQFIQINQSQGSIPQVEIKQDLPLEEDQDIKIQQQQFDTQNIINDDIFDQPLQVEQQQHQQRLNQIDQYEKKIKETQEIQESINFNNSDKKQQQEQKIENIVFDEYNQSRLQQQDNLTNQNIIEKQLQNNQQVQQHNHQNQIQDDLQNEQQHHYDQYESHQNHHHHHHNHHYNEQFRSIQYEDEQSYSEYEIPIHHHHHHHHHSFHHHNHQLDNTFQENDGYNLRGQNVVSKRNNLRGNKFRDDSLNNNNDPEIIDRIIIEYNFSQRENDELQEQQQQQPNQTKKDHKKENPIPGPKKQQIQYGDDESQQSNNKNTQNQNKNQQSIDNQNKKQKSKTQSQSNDAEEGENNEQENNDQTQNDKQIEQNEPKKSSTQKQNNNQDKDNKQQQNASQNKNAKSLDKSGTNQQEEEESNQNNNEDDENNSEQKAKSKNKNNKQKNQENQEENEAQNENDDEEVKQQEQDQEQAEAEKEKENEDEEEKEEQQQDENQEEQEENAQEKQQDKQKSKTKKKQSKENDKEKEKGKKNKQKTQDLEEENNENENIEDEEELYDFNGRYIPNDPFYEHRKSKRGRFPFNYPTRDPYQDMFEDERFWRYETMRRQQVRFPFNGYPYRHRKQTVDHSPFPHVNSYYKMHPYQQQTYHCSPWVGRDFYPDTGYGMSRVTAAYKGRYTDPDQVLRDLTIKQQQQKQWKKSIQQYRDQVGYKQGDYDLDFQPDYSQSYDNIVQQYPDYDSTIQDPSQFQPYEEEQKKTYDYLNDPQYKFRQGKKPLVKNDRIKTFNRYQEDTNDCFVVYDQCNFQGNRLDLCGEYPDIPQYINGFKIFSFIVPDNLQIRFFQSTDFENNVQNVEGTSDCLKVPYELVPNLQQ